MTRFRLYTRSQLLAYQYAYGNKTASGVCLQNIFDYSPFGAALDGRTMQGDGYRYSYQGQEHDDEVKGEGNSVNYEYRMHDPRVGRFFMIDPLFKDYPWNSTYAFSENRVIDGIELEGLEIYYTSQGELIGKYGDNTEIRLVFDEDVEAAKYIFAYQNSGFILKEEMNNHLYNSGSSPVYKNMDNLAIEWGTRNNELSISDKKEYSSFIYKTIIDGKNYLGYTKPIRGTESSASGTFTKTAKRSLLGLIHSHGNYIENFDNNNFSDEYVDTYGEISGDIYTYKALQIDGYVSTPNGSLLKYTEYEGVTLISSEMAADPLDPEACDENINGKSTVVILERSTNKIK